MAVQMYGAVAGVRLSLPERFERKYFLAPRQVGLAYGLLRQTCPAAGDYPSEQINSLYFDTSDLDEYERSDSGDFRKDKVRIRWYGAEEELRGMQSVFLELKSRRGFAGTKQRLKLRVPAESLVSAGLGKGIISGTLLMDTMASFGYFPSGMLLPIVRISYWRYRFCEPASGQRISLDCHIRSTLTFPALGNGERELELPGGLVEIKGRTMDVPVALSRARILDMDWTRFSKYSASIEAHIQAPGTVGRLSPSGRIVQL